MTTIDLKATIRSAVAAEWPVFAERHPHLAAVVDQELLVETAAERLADDPEYKDTMEAASAIGISAANVQDFVVGFVAKFLKLLA